VFDTRETVYIATSILEAALVLSFHPREPLSKVPCLPLGEFATVDGIIQVIRGFESRHLVLVSIPEVSHNIRFTTMRTKEAIS
jgi:hypothetical protein